MKKRFLNNFLALKCSKMDEKCTLKKNVKNQTFGERRGWVYNYIQILVRAECVRQRNEVAINSGVN